MDVEFYDDASLYAEESSTDLNEVLHHALERLPAVQRSVILLRDYEGYHYNEIAEYYRAYGAPGKDIYFQGPGSPQKLSCKNIQYGNKR